jgi:hypothetical protein
LSSGSEDQKKQSGSITSLKKASLQVKCVYQIGPPAWIRKEMSAKTIKKYLVSYNSYSVDATNLGIG